MEFTAEEIREAVRTARLYSPGLTAKQLEGAVELQKRLADSGYLEAVHAVARLEKEEGVLCTEALDACRQLLQEKAELEQRVGDFEARLETLKSKIREAGDRQREVEEATERAKGELLAVQAELQKGERELSAFRKKADKQKGCIDKEVEEYRQKANATREEITGASKLKEQLASLGFSIEFALDLCQEFVGRENAKEELAKAIEEHGTLIKSNAALIEQGKAQKEALESELNELKSEKDRREAEIKNFEQARHQLENILGQLQADVAHEEELRRFYYRYYGREGLLECLASWDQIFFLRCNNPLSALAGVFDRSAAGAHFWTDKPATRCPHCGLTMLLPDEKPYQALNWPVGVPIKLQLGE